MTTEKTTATIPSRAHGIPAWLTLLLATACGMITANVYYVQPLIGVISSDLGMSPHSAGLIVTLTQLGFAAGMVLIVPLADLIENRRLVFGVTGINVIALASAALTKHPRAFLVAALFIGLSSVSAQILVPYASHLAHESVRGRTVGNVMSGLMIGIMLSRPLSSFLAEVGSWHTVFNVSAIAMLVLAISLRLALPKRLPHSKLSYGRLLGSMVAIARTNHVLQRRAIYHSFQFGAFTLFWTVTPLVLTGPTFHLSQAGVALFGLAAVAGVIAAPIAGRMADRGWSRLATGLGMLSVAAAFLITHIAEPGSTLALALLTVAAIMLDFGITMTLVTGQRAIFTQDQEVRGRLNAVYMTSWYNRRRDRLGDRRLGLSAGWMELDFLDRSRTPHHGVALFRNRKVMAMEWRTMELRSPRSGHVECLRECGETARSRHLPIWPAVGKGTMRVAHASLHKTAAVSGGVTNRLRVGSRIHVSVARRPMSNRAKDISHGWCC